jgi:hypothetical protein
MICDPAEDVGEIGLGIDPVQFAGFGNGVEDSGALSAGIGSTEEVILPAMSRVT